jgi:hypothetical protein
LFNTRKKGKGAMKVTVGERRKVDWNKSKKRTWKRTGKKGDNRDDGEEGVKKETGKENGTLENDKRVKVKYEEIRNSFANDIQ